MPDTVTGFRRIRDRLRARGFVVHEVTHWEGRGSSTLRPGGKVNHHTAGGRAGGNTGSLRLVTFGRPDLRNALCNWYTARNGDLWIVAALTAWHAGSGGWAGISGNSRVIGNEAENDGLGEPWSPRSLAAQRALDEECVREFGYGTAMIPEHKEWTSRKPDRRGIHGPTWRAEVAAGLRSGPTPTPIEEDEMNVTMLSVPPKGTTDPSGKELHRVSLSIDSPAQCENGWWTHVSVTPAGPPKRKSEGFKVWIEHPNGGGWPGNVIPATGNWRYFWRVPVGTTMLHFENLDEKLPTGLTLATVRQPK